MPVAGSETADLAATLAALCGPPSEAGWDRACAAFEDLTSILPPIFEDQETRREGEAMLPHLDAIGAALSNPEFMEDVLGISTKTQVAGLAVCLMHAAGFSAPGSCGGGCTGPADAAAASPAAAAAPGGLSAGAPAATARAAVRGLPAQALGRALWPMAPLVQSIFEDLRPEAEPDDLLCFTAASHILLLALAAAPRGHLKPIVTAAKAHASCLQASETSCLMVCISFASFMMPYPHVFFAVGVLP